MAHWLDEAGKGLVSGRLSRRDVLRRGGGAFAGAVLFGLAPGTRSARAQVRASCAQPTQCPPWEVCCGGPGDPFATGAPGTCCGADICCGGTCCDTQCCGDTCCGTGQECCNGECCSGECCDGECCSGECCDGECCRPGHKCHRGRCVKDKDDHDECRGNGERCDSTEDCCQDGFAQFCLDERCVFLVSDEALKQDIRPLTGALSRIRRL